MKDSASSNPRPQSFDLLEGVTGRAAVRPLSAVPVVCRLSEIAAADLARIELDSNPAPWSEKLFASEFSNPCSAVFGARSGGMLAGFIVRHAIIDEAHIVNFAVAPEFRRRGVGRHLMVYTLEELHQSGVHWATLEVRRSNSIARALYESLGFQEAGLRTGYYPDNQEDALIMKISITDFTDRNRR